MQILLVIGLGLTVLSGILLVVAITRPSQQPLRGLHINQRGEPLAPSRSRIRRGLHVNERVMAMQTPAGERPDPNDPTLLENLRHSGLRPDAPAIETDKS